MSQRHVVEDSPQRNIFRKNAKRRWGNQFGSGILFATIPYGCPEDTEVMPGETGEQRAFRRFPITSHKPGR